MELQGRKTSVGSTERLGTGGAGNLAALLVLTTQLSPIRIINICADAHPSTKQKMSPLTWLMGLRFIVLIFFFQNNQKDAQQMCCTPKPELTVGQP